MKKLLSFLLLSLGILGLAISEEIPSDGTAVWEYTPISGSECLPYYQISDDNNTCYFATWLLPSNAYASGYSWECYTPYEKDKYGDSDYSYRCSNNSTTNTKKSKKALNLPNCPGKYSPTWNNCYIDSLEDFWGGYEYSGGIIDGKYGGQGTLTLSSGEIYRGEFLNNKRNGKGTNWWPDGSKYIGEWRDDKYHGLGATYLTNGKLNQLGAWKEGLFQYKIPSNASIHYTSWKCNSGYTQIDNSCTKNIAIPPNAYASGSSWKCNSGYNKTGNSCSKKIAIPPNAYASGSSWKCNSGYTKSNKNCIQNPVDNQVYSAASGSGFAVTSDGYVITNYHVIKGCTDVYIHDKGESILSTIVTFDPNNDIALLKGNFKPKNFYPLSRESTKLLTEVYVAGHPFGRDISTSVKVTRGIVSSLTGVANNFSNLQIDASLQPGNSGGPIMNDKGNVIGVAVAKLNLDSILEDYGVVPENVNFGVKANVVINIMESENIKLPKPNINSMPMSELSEIITDGTYYLSCWMTMAQINKMRETKVIFKSLK